MQQPNEKPARRRTGPRPAAASGEVKRTTLMLDQEHIDLARDIGNGNASAGVRIALKAYRKRGSKT